MRFNERFAIGAPAQRRPYIPSFAASSTLLGEPRHESNPGLHVSNGHLLGASNGGVITLGSEQWGVDLVAAESNGSVLELSPTEKDYVHVSVPELGVGTMHGEGVVILSHFDTGMLVIAGIVTACRWTAEDAHSRGARVSSVYGQWVIQSDSVNRAEVIDISNSGEATARILPS